MTASPSETHLAGMTKEVLPDNLSIYLSSRARLRQDAEQDAERGQVSWADDERNNDRVWWM